VKRVGYTAFNLPQLPTLFRTAIVALSLTLTLNAQSDNFLKTFIDKLSVSAEAKPLYDPAMQDENRKAAALIPSAPADLLALSLPSADTLLAKGTAGQKSVVIGVLYEIARRPDGTALLKPYLREILASLRDPEPGTVYFASLILQCLFPQPTNLVVPYVTAYVNDPQVNEELRAAAIGTLVWYSPNDPSVISAITDFMKEEHSTATRAGAVQTLGLMLPKTQRYSPELVELIVAAAKNDPAIRLQSVEALGRCGWKAYNAANPILSEIAGDEHETAQIRAAAKEAIVGILRSRPY
jgi:hypothetical protein